MTKPYLPPAPTAIKAVIYTHAAFGAILTIGVLLDGGILSAPLMLAAFGVAAALYFRPGKNSRLAATILSVLWLFTIVGIPFAAAILFALWTDKSSQYIDAAQQARHPAVPGIAY